MVINWLAILFSAFSICNVSGYFIVVDANAEECFFDRVTAGTKMSLTFEVAEGGFLDIDVTVRIVELMLLRVCVVLFLEDSLSAPNNTMIISLSVETALIDCNHLWKD